MFHFIEENLRRLSLTPFKFSKLLEEIKRLPVIDKKIVIQKIIKNLLLKILILAFKLYRIPEK